LVKRIKSSANIQDTANFESLKKLLQTEQ